LRIVPRLHDVAEQHDGRGRLAVGVHGKRLTGALVAVKS
jgi:hypothetical protein